LLGLTGNIACGKSTVGRLLAERYQAEYIDADAVVRERYAPDTPETAAIARRFGSHLRQADGTIDRRRLGDLVMADPNARRDLERILDPAVRRALTQRIERARALVVVLDAIRLIESGLAERCDAVWVVTCPRPIQVQRLRTSRGFGLGQAETRIDAQSSQAEKVARATTVIENDGSLAELEHHVAAAWARLESPVGQSPSGASQSPIPDPQSRER
jgi:dephospho-CoA kinase